MIDLPENVHDLLEDGTERFGKTSKPMDKLWWKFATKFQPTNFSWITLDVSTNHIATDTSNAIYYENNSEFRTELLKYIEAYFSDELIRHYREGRLTEIKIVLGSRTPSGDDLNEDMGDDFEPNYGQISRKDI